MPDISKYKGADGVVYDFKDAMARAALVHESIEVSSCVVLDDCSDMPISADGACTVCGRNLICICPEEETTYKSGSCTCTNHIDGTVTVSGSVSSNRDWYLSLTNRDFGLSATGGTMNFVLPAGFSGKISAEITDGDIPDNTMFRVIKYVDGTASSTLAYINMNGSSTASATLSIDEDSEIRVCIRCLTGRNYNYTAQFALIPDGASTDWVQGKEWQMLTEACEVSGYGAGETVVIAAG